MNITTQKLNTKDEPVTTKELIEKLKKTFTYFVKNEKIDKTVSLQYWDDIKLQYKQLSTEKKVYLITQINEFYFRISLTRTGKAYFKAIISLGLKGDEPVFDDTDLFN